MASLKVAVRVRPLNKREIDMSAQPIIQMDGKRTRIFNTKTPSSTNRDNDRQKHNDFTYDHSYWSFDDTDEHYASQEEVFYDLGMDVVESAFEGYNACVFAYGQTGSGKTFTMMGSPESPGLIPRICKTLFSEMAKRTYLSEQSLEADREHISYKTEVSYMEIYNEKVRDLLKPDQNMGRPLKVREHPKHGTFVQNLSTHLVYDYSDIQECMARGNTQRSTACTAMNSTSSRSHAIFTITFAQATIHNGNMPSEIISKVHLVDLAGSERADATKTTGDRLKEGGHINKSLVTLGSVISGLSSNSVNRNFIPYRNSNLTWLLKDSLGGNSKTIMIATISPADCNYSETISTLRYANRAKNIINMPTINEDPNVKLIRELRDEIETLKSLISRDVCAEKPQVLLAQIHEKQEQEKVLTEEWTEKWRETQKILSEQRVLGLRKSGVGVVLDSEMPHLVGIDDDILSTGVTLYHLKEGRTLVGTEEATSLRDIVLTGMDVEPEHCVIELESGVATLHPLSPHCWINTAQIDKPTRLSHSCIILLGRNNMFRYNDPAEAAKLRREGGLGNGNLHSAVVNLSRLSLLSCSVSDLHASSSSDNLNSSEDLVVLEELEQQKAALIREREEFKREQEEREERWTARREALEEAQRELEREWGAQWREWAEGIAALEQRQRDLRQRRQQLEQQRRDEMTQVENLCREVASLHTTLQSKQRQYQEFVNAQNRTQSQQRTSSEQTDQGAESDTSLPESWLSLNEDKSADAGKKFLNNKNEITELRLKIEEKIKISSDHQSKVDKMDEELSDLIERQHEISSLRLEGVTDKRILLAARSQEQLDDILRRKRSLSLNLRCALPASPDARSTSSDEMLSSTDQLVNGSDNDENQNRKRKIAAALNLIYPVLSHSIDTAESGLDTFHTAAADSPPDKFPNAEGKGQKEEKETADAKNDNEDNDNDLDFKTSIDEIKEFQKCTPETKLNGVDNDSADSTETNSCSSPPMENQVNDSAIDTDHSQLHSEDSVLERSRTMKILDQKIARQRTLIMKCLEASPSSKDELNRQITVLQDLQRQQIELEDSLLNREQNSNGQLYDVSSSTTLNGSCDGLPRDVELELCNNDRGRGATDKSIESFCNSANNLSNSPTRSYLRSRSSNDEDDNQNSRCSVVRVPQIRGYSSVYLASLNRGDRLTSPYSLTITRSLPSLITNENNPDSIVNMIVSVPSYVIRGAGTSSHYEYEVRVVAVDGSWTLLRRYRRFRELYVSMRQKYGSEVSNISFPPRQMFARYEVVARQRRKRLEEYLRRLIQVCSQLPSCEALYKFKGNLSQIDKQSLHEFSSFFRRGTFESSKYGTS